MHAMSAVGRSPPNRLHLSMGLLRASGSKHRSVVMSAHQRCRRKLSAGSLRDTTGAHRIALCNFCSSIAALQVFHAAALRANRRRAVARLEARLQALLAETLSESRTWYAVPHSDPEA